MYAQKEKSKENKNKAVANSVSQKKNKVKQDFGFVDNRERLTTIQLMKGTGDDRNFWTKNVPYRLGGRDAGDKRSFLTRVLSGKAPDKHEVLKITEENKQNEEPNSIEELNARIKDRIYPESVKTIGEKKHWAALLAKKLGSKKSESFRGKVEQVENPNKIESEIYSKQENVENSSKKVWEKSLKTEQRKAILKGLRLPNYRENLVILLRTDLDKIDMDTVTNDKWEEIIERYEFLIDYVKAPKPQNASKGQETKKTLWSTQCANESVKNEVLGLEGGEAAAQRIIDGIAVGKNTTKIGVMKVRAGANNRTVFYGVREGKPIILGAIAEHVDKENMKAQKALVKAKNNLDS